MKLTFYKVNGNKTFDENMCDNGGLTNAWHAYKSSKKVDHDDDLLLPGVNHTQDQIFFISYGQVCILWYFEYHLFFVCHG